MTPAPLVVRESTNLEDAARYVFISVTNVYKSLLPVIVKLAYKNWACCDCERGN